MYCAAVIPNVVAVCVWTVLAASVITTTGVMVVGGREGARAERERETHFRKLGEIALTQAPERAGGGRGAGTPSYSCLRILLLRPGARVAAAAVV